MPTELTPTSGLVPGAPDDGRGRPLLPAVVLDAGPDLAKRYLEFFTAHIRNPNTRRAYGRNVGRFFAWIAERGLAFEQIEPIVVAAYVEELTWSHAAPTVKQHLAAIRMLYDFLVTGGLMRDNPAAAVRGPKHVVTRGKTPVLDAGQAKELIESIDTSTILGLRDRALIGTMVYTFARVGAVVAMNVKDFHRYQRGWAFMFQEKGGKEHRVPASHKAEECVFDYLEAGGLEEDRKGPLFRTVGRDKQLTENRLTATDVLRMVKRRGKAIGLSPDDICCHTWRATGITAFLENGGTLEGAQQIAAHASARTTKLYDRTDDDVTREDVERIAGAI